MPLQSMVSSVVLPCAVTYTPQNHGLAHLCPVRHRLNRLVYSVGILLVQRNPECSILIASRMWHTRAHLQMTVPCGLNARFLGHSGASSPNQTVVFWSCSTLRACFHSLLFHISLQPPTLCSYLVPDWQASIWCGLSGQWRHPNDQKFPY